MCLNPVNEEFDRAYANVGLLASDVWSYQNEEVDYKKANLHLWIRFNETEKRLIEDDSSDDLSTSTEAIYTVQDVIPFSRLATYNNFEYNEGREKIYVASHEPLQYIQNSYHLGHKDLEVWMLPEVEREFKRYTKGSQSGWCMLSPRYPSGRELVSIDRITNTSPQKWLSETQWPNRLLSHYAEKLYSLKLSTDPSLFRDDLEPPVYDPEEVEMKLLEYPCPRYLVETNIDHRLHEIINSPTIRNLWAAPNYPYGSYSQTFGLNAEVPEFQPVAFSSKIKVDGDNFDSMKQTQSANPNQIVNGFSDHESNFGASHQHYISIFDMNYEAEVFPYSSTPSKYEADPELMIETNEELQQNPAVINPSGLYFNLELLKPNCKSQQEGGGSSTNIVTLPDSDLNEITEQQIEPWIHVGGGQSLNKNQSTEKMIAFLEKWVTKIYNPRSIDFNQMSSSSGRINKIFQNVQQGYCLIQGSIPVLQPPAQRPLYSDVLMSEANPAATNSESKFDELEQEALEQYSGSDTLIPPSQVSENVITSEQGTPRLSSQESKHQILSSPPPAAEKNSETQTSEELASSHPKQEPNCSGLSDELGNIGKKIESKIEACHSNMQAKWIKKKKKKTEKKKKNVKNNKKKHPVDNNKKHIGAELILSIKFLELLSSFNHVFMLDDWKLVQDNLTAQVKHIFEKVLSIFKDCSEWFIFLMMERDRFENPSNTFKRGDLMRKIVNLSEDLITNFQKYILLFNKMKMTIHCDHRLYFSPERLIRQRSIMSPMLYTTSLNEDNIFCNKVGLLATVPNGKYFLRLLNSVIQEEKLTVTYKHKWKLPQVFETSVNRRSYEIQINFKEWKIHLAESELEKEDQNCYPTRKLVKLVEDYPTWYSWQWRFVDGWKLDMSDTSFSFHWCNRFNVKILEQIATSARLFVMYDWILDLIDAVVLNKHFSTCELVWNRKIPNLVSSKMVFYRLLLQKDRDWYFGDVRINQQACCRLYSGCENQCCVTWMLNYDSKNTTVRPSMSMVKGHTSRGAQMTMRSTRSRCRKEDAKNLKNRSKSKTKKSRSPKKKIIFNDIQGVNHKMNLPQERSICVIQ